MAFDYKTFLDVASRGGTPIQSTAAGFGIPDCILELAEDILRLLPSSVLAALNKFAEDALAPIDRFVKYFVKKLRDLFGIIVTVDEDGNVIYILKYFKYALAPLAFINTINKYLSALTEFLGDLYTAIQGIEEEIDRIKACLDSLKRKKDFNELVRDNSNDQEWLDYIERRFGRDRQILDENDRRRRDLLDFIDRINRILDERRRNPSLEPELNPAARDILGDIGFRFPDVIPAIKKEIFRLSYGPPVAKEGKFILSVDGLYFDSQASGLTPALVELNNRKDNLQKNTGWKFEFDPNLGGRGKEITLNNIKEYVNTILDDASIDEGRNLKNYYDQDELLQSLLGQRNRRVFDVSSQLQDAQDENLSIALIDNLRQVMISESSHFMQKINKRKKQIELAVKLPVIYGDGLMFEPGRIPINDFSYLEGINFKVDLLKQKKLILNQEEVSGVVLPLEVKYVQQINQPEEIRLDHLIINNIGLGGIVANGSGVEAPMLSINQSIERDGLLALYNLLRFDVVDPSSSIFKLRNSSEGGPGFDAQIVGRSEEEVFGKGVGIAYLEGITKNSKDDPTVPSAVGSYIRLPDNNQSAVFKDLLYTNTGATFESWVYVPEIDGTLYGYTDENGASSLYRLLLANENTGIRTGVSSQPSILQLRRDYSTDVVNGMIFGFTRDRRLTKDLPPSNISEENPAEDTCLVLAPTQSYDSSSVGFINKSFDSNGQCYTLESKWYNMKIPILQSVNGVSLSSCGNQFCLISLTFDPPKNKISIYCDGQLLAASSYQDVFGIDPYKEIVRIPSVTKPNSFEYNQLNMYGTSSTKLKSGPKLDTNFTPWIIGGGYTDGLQNGNFMGGEYGGIRSGLRGFVGGVKFYSKPLSNEQVLSNFNASKNFFKNIDIPTLGWEPIISE